MKRHLLNKTRKNTQLNLSMTQARHGLQESKQLACMSIIELYVIDLLLITDRTPFLNCE
jgi:hypothetical protein